jgi:POT family proton-dependent oligopeptide transporter
MILGNLLVSAPQEMFITGLHFLLWHWVFKPNISSMVGELYHEDDARRDAGYGMFYAGINIGDY